MTPDQLQQTAIRIYGRKRWKAHLARDLGVDVSTIHRLTHRAQVPGPYEVALRGMLDHRKREIALEKEARKLLPRRLKLRKKRTVPKPRLIKAAGCT